MATFARAKIEVQAEFAIDPVDFVPLALRRRMIRSGRCDTDGLSRNVSLQAILDLFVGDLVNAVKPVSSFFGGKGMGEFDYGQGRSSHRQSYNVSVPSGRMAEVAIDAFVGHALATDIRDDNVDISQYFWGSSSSSVACQTEVNQKINSSEPESMPCKFGIVVKIEPSDTAPGISCGPDFSCGTSLRNCNLTSASERNKGDLLHPKSSLEPANGVDNMTKCSEKRIFVSPAIKASFPFKEVRDAASKLETDKISRHSSEIAHNADTGYSQVVKSALPSSLKRVEVDIKSDNVVVFEKIDPELASTVSPDHGSGEQLPCNDPMLSDVKPTVVGQKRVVCDADNSARGLPLSSYQTIIKSEPIEESHSSTYAFQEKASEFCPYFPASDSMSINRRTCSGDPILSEYEDNTNHSSLSLHSKFGVPSLEEKQANPHGYSCTSNEPEISGTVETSEINISAVAHEDPADLFVVSKSLSFLVDVKTEPLDTDVVSYKNLEPLLSRSHLADVKMENIDELKGDELDHINLKDRMKMLMAGRGSSLGYTSNLKCLEHVEPHISSSRFVTAAKSVEKKAGISRKRKKTATDSIETALAEDAPGLLQVLVEQGIDLHDIKLYGSLEDDDLADISSEDGFEELENVISQLFVEPSNLLPNLASLRGRRGSKAVYCLACLVSLIEQIQYLQFRQCPAQWGWCRDLQSFIFVFEKHNRIVLERPEYGYATYFFELLDSLPVDWQIRRLVIAMKATYCSRAIIVENKSLMVGQDLTEGEARVLEEFGWKPNTGLGSLLNFRDRVIHDRRNESDNSEWRARISKLLMDGHDAGNLVVDYLPKKVAELYGDGCPFLKLEM